MLPNNNNAGARSQQRPHTNHASQNPDAPPTQNAVLPPATAGTGAASAAPAPSSTHESRRTRSAGTRHGHSVGTPPQQSAPTNLPPAPLPPAPILPPAPMPMQPQPPPLQPLQPLQPSQYTYASGRELQPLKQPQRQAYRDRERDRDDRPRDREGHRERGRDKEKDERSKDKDTPPIAGLDKNVIPGSVMSGLEALPHVIRANGVSYVIDRVIGNGSFGVVLQARSEATGDVVAIKRVLQDKRYKNRELQIMRILHHPNVVELKNNFFVNGPKGDDVFLNLVLEFVPETMYKFARDYVKRKQSIPICLVKLSRALGYIHAFNVCHRDIKPQNLLVDPATGTLKLCDFGSAKILQRGEANVSYICSRYYRAPELIFGSTNYTTAIDIWSMGCVMAELLIGQPIFPGDSSVDQLVEIIKVLGTPTYEQIQAMNKNYPAYNFPDIKPHPWNKVFKSGTPPEAIDLLSRMLQYTPSKRPLALEVCAHPFFDELRSGSFTLGPNVQVPPLFSFTPEELNTMRNIGVEHLMIPSHIRNNSTAGLPPGGGASSIQPAMH